MLPPRYLIDRELMDKTGRLLGHRAEPSLETRRVPNGLSNIAGSSDAGGIAARKGFRIQDHVAARLALEMMHNTDIIQIECETGDDIVLRRNDGGAEIIEYVQVKTTESDSKWNIKELTTRVKSKVGSSVCEKSLLCDKHGETAWFRFVSTRDISTKLAPFKRPRLKRNAGDADHAALISSFSGKYKTVLSTSGRGLGEWSETLLWEVEGSEDALVSRNINMLLRLSSGRGVNPSYETMEAVYKRLADKLRTMGDTPSSDHEGKIWRREESLNWWQSQVSYMQTAAVSTVKVYQIANIPKFFSEISSFDEKEILRSMYAYDVEFDGDAWRKDELIGHLLDSLPEIALPARTLANFNHLAARRLPSEALKELDRRGATDIPQVVAALILHAILRHHFEAEPIACRIFFSVGRAMRSSSAHIVPLPTGDEIWLGRSRLVTATTHDDAIDEILQELRTALTRDVLIEEREIIIQLREPRHLREDNLDSILNSTGKTSELLKILRLPILVAYDSETLNAGFSPDYLVGLQKEVETEYQKIVQKIGEELKSVQISLFLVPVECAETLAVDFEKKLRG